MDLTPDFQEIDTLVIGSSTPVILPLSGGKEDGRPARVENNRHAVVQRFSFPEMKEPIAETPAPEAPMVIWPECESAAKASACAVVAGTILRQISLDRRRLLLVTSPDDGDGKTDLVAALAPELAKHTTGSVLAVDANFRRPDLTSRLRVPRDKAPARSMLIYPTSLPRLSVLPAPMANRSLSEGFDLSANEELREGWSLVLLDGPSLVHPEAAPMARRCDGAYLVVRLGHTARRAVAEAADVLQAAGAKLLGCIVVG
jgi:Mrp family chromosome partitioning ATPase